VLAAYLVEWVLVLLALPAAMALHTTGTLPCLVVARQGNGFPNRFVVASSGRATPVASPGGARRAGRSPRYGARSPKPAHPGRSVSPVRSGRRLRPGTGVR